MYLDVSNSIRSHLVKKKQIIIIMHGYDCAEAGYCNAALKKEKKKAGEVGREGEEIQRGPVSTTAESGSMACSSRTEGAVGRGETG